MNVNDITQLVGTLGFPIVAYFYNVYSTNKKMDVLTEALNNNTKAIAALPANVTKGE